MSRRSRFGGKKLGYSATERGWAPTAAHAPDRKARQRSRPGGGVPALRGTIDGNENHLVVRLRRPVLGVLHLLGRQGRDDRAHRQRLLHRRAAHLALGVRARRHRDLVLRLDLHGPSGAGLPRWLPIRLRILLRDHHPVHRAHLPQAPVDHRQALRLRHAGRDAVLLLPLGPHPDPGDHRRAGVLGALSGGPAARLGLPVQRADRRPAQHRGRHVGPVGGGVHLRRLRRSARGRLRRHPAVHPARRRDRDHRHHRDERGRRLGPAAGQHRGAHPGRPEADPGRLQPLHRDPGRDPVRLLRPLGRGRRLDRHHGADLHVRPDGHPVGAGVLDVGVLQPQSRPLRTAAGLGELVRDRPHPVPVHRDAGHGRPLPGRRSELRRRQSGADRDRAGEQGPGQPV